MLNVYRSAGHIQVIGFSSELSEVLQNHEGGFIRRTEAAQTDYSTSNVNISLIL